MKSEEELGTLLDKFDPPLGPEVLLLAIVGGLLGLLLFWVASVTDSAWAGMIALLMCAGAFGFLVNRRSAAGKPVRIFTGGMAVGRRLVRWEDVTRVEYRHEEADLHHFFDERDEWDFKVRNSWRRIHLASATGNPYIDPWNFNVILDRHLQPQIERGLWEPLAFFTLPGARGETGRSDKEADHARMVERAREKHARRHGGAGRGSDKPGKFTGH